MCVYLKNNSFAVFSRLTGDPLDSVEELSRRINEGQRRFHWDTRLENFILRFFLDPARSLPFLTA